MQEPNFTVGPNDAPGYISNKAMLELPPSPRFPTVTAEVEEPLVDPHPNILIFGADPADPQI